MYISVILLAMKLLIGRKMFLEYRDLIFDTSVFVPIIILFNFCKFFCLPLSIMQIICDLSIIQCHEYFYKMLSIESKE